MADTPDLSKIVSLIMQNPALIEQISALAKSGESNESADITKIADDVAEIPTAKEVSVSPESADSHSQRRELLSALKPYLSENRRAAIDSMMSIADVLGMMRKK